MMWIAAVGFLIEGEEKYDDQAGCGRWWLECMERGEEEREEERGEDDIVLIPCRILVKRDLREDNRFLPQLIIYRQLQDTNS